MNLKADLDERIDRARIWLGQMQVDGGLRAHGMAALSPRDNPPAFSVSATAFSAHLCAWMWLFSKKDEWRRAARAAADWLVREWQRGRFSGDYNFFDYGIASRALFAISKTFNKPEYWDLSIQIAANMRKFRHPLPLPGCYYDLLSSSEPGLLLTGDWLRGDRPSIQQRKAALSWKLNKAITDYDDLDCALLDFETSTNYLVAPPVKLAAKSKKPDLVDLAWQVELQRYASSTEALIVGEASSDRGAAALVDLELQMQAGSKTAVRSDVVAQILRMKMFVTLGMPGMNLLYLLFEMQHESGGFHAMRTAETRSPELSVTSTIFAIQAMAMAQAADQVRARVGPLGRLELAIV